MENFDENDPALAQARNAFSLATEQLRKLSDARDPLSRETSKTPEQKLLLMATHAEKAQDRCAKAFDSAQVTYRSGEARGGFVDRTEQLAMPEDANPLSCLLRIDEQAEAPFASSFSEFAAYLALFADFMARSWPRIYPSR